MAVITRADWGAGPNRAAPVAPQRKTRTFLHHTVTPQWTGAQAARNLQRIARSRGFADISYSWLADRAGNEVEGRGWHRVGAHTKGYNTTAEAVSLIGNLDGEPVPAPMVAAASRLARRSRPGRITGGHRDVASTACPGRHGYAAIPQVNRTTHPSAQEEDDVRLTLVKQRGAPHIYAIGPAGTRRVPSPGVLRQLRDAGLIRNSDVPEVDEPVIRFLAGR